MTTPPIRQPGAPTAKAAPVSGRDSLTTVAAGVIAAAPAGASPQAVVATVIAAVSAAALVAGLALFRLGAAGLGRIARFLPYPVVGGFIAGVGLVVALLPFAAEYSRVRVVRRALTGATRRSRFTRGDGERRRLDAAGGRIIVLELQGYIFFGTVARLLDTLKAQLAARPAEGARCLILDFANVTGLDTSGLYAFSRLQQQSPAWNVAVLLSGLPRTARVRQP